MDRNSNDRTDEDGPRTPEGERLHDREDMSATDGMASTDDSPVERGEHQAHTGGGADR